MASRDTPCSRNTPPACSFALQSAAFDLWYEAERYRGDTSSPCCLSCNRVRQRAHASYKARVAFYRDMAKQQREELQAVEEGRPIRIVVLPTLRVDVPEEARQLDPLDTCAACRQLVEQVCALHWCRWLLLEAATPLLSA